jgi:hypothetical protein
MPWFCTQIRRWPVHSFRAEAAITVGLLALVLLSWLPRFNGPIDLRWDASVYYILGTSLAEGKGYRLLNEPGDLEAIQYPPLLPVLVAVHQWLLGTSDPLLVGHWLRLSFFLLFNIYILAVYSMARMYMPKAYALLATLLCLLNLHTYFLSDVYFPEIPFGITTLLFVLCHQSKRRRIYPRLAPLFAIASYALRTVGIALLAAWVAESLFTREWKRAAVRLLLALLPILGWQSYIAWVEASPRYTHPVYAYQRADYLFYNVSYARNIFALKDSFSPELGPASFGDIAERVVRNLIRIPASLGEAVSSKKTLWELQWAEFNKRLSFSHIASWPVHLTLFILGGFILGGIGLQLARREWIIPLYISFSLAIICLTPWPGQFNRYLMPLAPFLALSLFQGLSAVKRLLGKFGSAMGESTALALSLAIVLLILAQQSLIVFLVYTKWHESVIYSDQEARRIDYHLFFYHDAYRTLDAGLDWLRERAKPEEVMALSMPHWAYLRTGLKAVMPPFEINPVKAQQLLDSVPVKYLILDEGLAVETRKYTSPVVLKFPDKWKRVYSDPIIRDSGQEMQDRFEIYQRVDQ